MTTFRTKDLYEASSLMAAKAKLYCLEQEGNFYWFVFDGLDECRRLSDMYWRNELNVFAKDYSDAIKTLKDRLFARG